LGDVYGICYSLHCDSLCQLLNDDSSERVLSLLIQSQDQNDSNIDFSKYERSITQKIETYLKNPCFCLVSLPSLCRIFVVFESVIQVLKKQVMFMIFAILFIVILFVNFLMMIHLREFSLLIQSQDHNYNIDFSKYERSITQKIETYLKNPCFCLVSLPSLCRIFVVSNQAFSLSSLNNS